MFWLYQLKKYSIIQEITYKRRPFGHCRQCNDRTDEVNKWLIIYNVLKAFIRQSSTRLEVKLKNCLPLTVSRLMASARNRPFPSSPGRLNQTRLSTQSLIWKWFFIFMQIKLIFTRKAVHLASFWKCGFLDLGSGLLPLKICELETGVEEGQLLSNILTGTR